jgi:ferredoxin
VRQRAVRDGDTEAGLRMTVEFKFQPDGPSGLIAEGTSVLGAARRLGFQIPADCDGRGECDTCAVSVIKGVTLLSALTEAERRQLSAERLAGGERLACQCNAERGGELVLRLVSPTERSRTAEEKTRDLRKEFSELPLERKIATLIQLETIAMSQALDTIANRSVSIGKKLFDGILTDRGRTNQQHEAPPSPAGPAKK